ncbi:von Willebrand factor type A domain-containing protein [Pyrenochaeta sp. MPI-SDFR-AT-0127]|nr:von Willebrand factor type A domain-containing protein [Pyrenochaeta sp. MPI-SDFR-AT-0127]
MSLFHYSGYPAASAPWRAHICGLYYNINLNGYLQKTYLPQVELQAHATILATTSRTVLTQTFINPSTEKGIKEVRYTFPLYDGVSVVGFTCHVADRTIIGEVKEKQKARAVFKEAVARGETAGLLEQLPDAADVFTTTVGNIPPGARVIIKITYLGELKHDMEVDGIRFTIPNVICPRYGSYPGTLRTNPSIDAMGGKISITVDAEMAEGSFIQKIQSPTHPISMTMGTTSFAPNAEPTMTKASATLALGTAQLETDFVLQVIAKDTGVPKAVLETHPTIPNHRALMATLVPKFALPAEKPEIVFVCDRSGSMSGSRITLVIQALKVFLKSLPVGVKFNICSFGSKHSFLWKKSVTYSQSTLDEAIRHADTFSANFGGTEMLYPLKATIEQRYKDMPLEVMMLTDGEIWNQQALFSYLNQSVTESKAPIRIFTLGIGNGVSHSLIEGVAKAGNGFSQTVGEGEKMDSKVVRMLKGALSPHVNDYTLEVKYSTKNSEEEDDFEIVERVADSLKVKLDLKDSKEDKKATVGHQSKTIRTFFTDLYQKKPISLFDASVDPDKESPPAYDETGEERYAHLPKVPVPKIIQAPQNIPSLFAFNRTTAYLLLGPDAPQATPKSVVLRGTSTHGPLELEIPIHTFDLPGETIHQLAAKKAISELEQGRGWLPEAKNESGTLIKSKFEGRFDDMVEREAVRLGVQFQVGGKWCSFVAVESNRKNVEEKETETQGWEWLEDEANLDLHTDQLPTEQEDQQQYRRNRMAPNQELRRKSGSPRASLTQSINRVTERGERLELSAQTQVLSEQSKGFYSSAKKQKSSSLFGGGLFGSSKSSPPPPPPPGASSFGVQSFGGRGGGAFGGTTSSTSYSQAAPQANPFASASGGAIGGLNAPVRSSFSAQAPGGSTGQLSQGENALQDYHSQFLMLEQQNKKRLLMARQEPEGAQQQQQFQAFGAAPASAVPPPPRDMARRSSGAMANAPAPFSSTSIFGAPAAPVSRNDKAVLDNFDFDSFLANDDTDMGFSLDEEEGTKATRSRSAAPVPGHAVYAPAAYSAPVKSSPAPPSRSMPVASALPSKNAKPSKSLEELLHHLISLQTFEGSWECTAALLSELPLNQGLVKSEISGGGNKKHFATAIVIAVFEGKLGSFKGSWELVVDKAKEWLESEVGDAERLVERARKVLL